MKKTIIVIGLVGMCLGLKAQITETNGNVGIGNSSPDMKLSVTSENRYISRFHSNEFSDVMTGIRIGRKLSTGGNSYADLVNLSDGFGISAGSSGGNLPLSTQNIDHIAIFTNFSTRNVGIGTVNPQAKLDVNGDMIVQDYIKMYGAFNTGVIMNTLNSGQMQFAGGNSTADGANIRLGGSMGSNDLRIRIGTSEKFRIASNGNIGIGDDSPEFKLDLNAGESNTHARFIGSYAGIQGIQVERSGGDKIRLVSNYSGYGGGLESTSALRFSVNGNNINTPAIYVNTQGQTGIGTTSMGSHKLAVEGTIGAREIKVEASGWSDFVFYNNYKLATLEEVEKHIAEKGHLSEIPSEEEVKENGINLGEMDAKLLQKIEELTLYTIQQQKEIEALKLQNKKLFELQARLEKLESEK